jgi:hypothetical protein
MVSPLPRSPPWPFSCSPAANFLASRLAAGLRSSNFENKPLRYLTQVIKRSLFGGQVGCFARRANQQGSVIFYVQSCLQKYFAFPVGQIKLTTCAVSPLRGAYHDRRETRGGMRWTQMVLLTRAPSCGRQSRVVLTPRRRRQVSGGNSADDGDKKADHRGARRKPLKPLRAGMPGYSGATVVTTLVCFLHFAREAAGALGTRHSPRPLFQGESFMHNSGASRRGNAELYLLLAV